jgi:hypothetical protein
MANAHSLYLLFTGLALLGWLALIASLLGAQPLWRDVVAGRLVPAMIALAYLVVMALFWGDAPGDFSSLAGLQSLFSSPWLTLVAWLHYLAGDLVVGAHLARRATREGWPLWLSIPVVLITMLVLPAGLLAAELVRLVRKPAAAG